MGTPSPLPSYAPSVTSSNYSPPAPSPTYSAPASSSSYSPPSMAPPALRPEEPSYSAPASPAPSYSPPEEDPEVLAPTSNVLEEETDNPESYNDKRQATGFWVGDYGKPPVFPVGGGVQPDIWSMFSQEWGNRLARRVGRIA